MVRRHARDFASALLRTGAEHLWTRQGQRLQIMLDRCDRSTRWAPPRGEGTTPAAAEEREPSKIRWTVATQPADYKEKIMSDRPSTRALTLGHQPRSKVLLRSRGVAELMSRTSVPGRFGMNRSRDALQVAQPPKSA